MRASSRADEFARLACEARSRALRSEGTAHSHWMGMASGLDLAAAQLRGDVLERESEVARHARHGCGWSHTGHCEVET